VAVGEQAAQQRLRRAHVAPRAGAGDDGVRAQRRGVR